MPVDEFLLKKGDTYEIITALNRSDWLADAELGFCEFKKIHGTKGSEYTVCNDKCKYFFNCLPMILDSRLMDVETDLTTDEEKIKRFREKCPALFTEEGKPKKPWFYVHKYTLLKSIEYVRYNNQPGGRWLPREDEELQPAPQEAADNSEPNKEAIEDIPEFEFVKEK